MAEKKEKKAKNIHEIKVEITGKDWEKKLDETFKKIIIIVPFLSQQL